MDSLFEQKLPYPDLPKVLWVRTVNDPNWAGIEPHKYVPLIEKWWNIRTAFLWLNEYRILYTPTHSFKIYDGDPIPTE